ncbi:hypothetical protein I79_009510 [Cricetulus griseus]|uniref:Uncharacterized protein n=1 Tax=Cricetulus griseus TaxID=10029 RepID=G3HFZ2_CRIGR|nr:hypothetical protein I79_009510 [Cricetulus griseus]
MSLGLQTECNWGSCPLPVIFPGPGAVGMVEPASPRPQKPFLPKGLSDPEPCLSGLPQENMLFP